MDVPRMYGDKSTAHRLHLETCGADAHARIFREMVFRGYLDDKFDISCCSTDAKERKRKRRFR